MASLVYSDSAGRQVVYRLEKDRVSIGRSSDSDLVSLDLRVSRRHASILRDGQTGAFRIVDEGSSLGVYVNQKPIQEALLQDGDVIRVGDSIYSFVDMPEDGGGSISQMTLTAVGPSPSDAGLRGTALAAELEEAIVTLRESLRNPAADRRIMDQCFTLVESRLSAMKHRLVRIERARLMMQTLYDVGRVINSAYDRENLLEIILDQAVKVVRAERGFLTLYDPASGKFTRRAANNMGAGEQDFSTGIAVSVATSGEPVVTTDAQSDERFRERQSIMDLNILSAMCVPLVDRSQKVMGVIYVDTRASVVTFTRDDQEFLMAFANYASIAIENAALFLEAAAKARAEEELRLARKMDEMKSDLISIVSHDVRTPLTSIKSYAEILYDDLEDLEPSKQRHYLDIINREADRLSRLVTNYLDLQKIEAGMMRLSFAQLEIAALVGESIEAFEGAAVEKGLRLERSLEPSLPAVKGDRDRLLQVVANLLSNAIKFTPPGGTITLGAASTLLPGRGRAVALTVRDTGEGIPPDKVDKLFRRFSQLGEPGSQGQKGGTGLGLVFSREIVDLHGGRIGASSKPGEGTTFEVILPVDGP